MVTIAVVDIENKDLLHELYVIVMFCGIGRSAHTLRLLCLFGAGFSVELNSASGCWFSSLCSAWSALLIRSSGTIERLPE